MNEMTGLRLWEPFEDELVRLHYPDYRLLRTLLTERTLAALKHRARVLGVVRRRHVWTNKDREKLNTEAFERATRAELEDMFPGMGTRQVLAMARYLNIKRRPRRPMTLNCACLDSIRARAWEMGWFLSKLDKEAGTSQYFSDSVRKIGMRQVYQAIKALGGRVTIEWDDLN